MSVIVELSIFPMDKGDSVSPYVAKAARVIAESGLPYVMGAMATSFEGEWDEVMGVVNDCYKVMEQDSNRVLVYMRADSRKGRVGGLEGKLASLQSKMGETP